MFEKDTSVTLLGTLRARMVFTNLSGTFSSVPALKSIPKFESIEVCQLLECVRSQNMPFHDATSDHVYTLILK
jgi:hypothetical protein